ncbi:hypothetical protein KV697_18565 [Sphingomonas sanguinis]|uniref:hypothetical protein n=1 Tax=Sphingomonas sanguinis TaxID=33051 RepID=UPI001C599361|nr:hypothetical protein [Sphingomonas sanguinis]QXT35678.1 hypothetical protein KV697_18565 [Sphingomonas sanguinis]
MTLSLSRAIMAIATACMGEDRRSWSQAMNAEYHVAADDGQALSFAAGCLVAAWREMLGSAKGRFVLTSYALALGIMVPMAAIEIGCAVLGLPYLYPDQRGLSGALLVGASHEALLRPTYLGAIPALALLQLGAGTGHLRLAWSLLDRDWPGALRWSLWTLAGMTTLVIFMSVFFLDSRQALIQGCVVGIELAILLVVMRRHAELYGIGPTEQPG